MKRGVQMKDREYMDNNARNGEGSLLRTGYGNKAIGWSLEKSLNLRFYIGLF